MTHFRDSHAAELGARLRRRSLIRRAWDWLTVPMERSRVAFRHQRKQECRRNPIRCEGQS